MKHIEYIDPLRFFAMLGVIYLHICGVMINQGVVAFGTLDWELLNLGESLAYSAVAVFFMISGFLLLSSPRTGDVAVLLKKRLPRLIVPLLAWTAVASLWIGHLTDDYSIAGLLGRFAEGIYGPIMTHFWFMFSLIALYAISPILYGGLNSLDEKGRRFVLAVILLLNLRAMLSCFFPDFVSRFLRFDLLNRLDLYGGALSVFLLGWYLGNLKTRVPNWILAAAAGLLFVLISLGTRSFYLRNGHYDASFHNQTLGFQVALAACLFLLFKQNALRSGRRFALASAVPLTFPIYFLHVITMELFFGLGWMPGSFLGALAFTLVNFLFCLLLTKTAASIAPLCYLSTGLRYREARESCTWQHELRVLREKRARRNNPSLSP